MSGQGGPLPLQPETGSFAVDLGEDESYQTGGAQRPLEFLGGSQGHDACGPAMATAEERVAALLAGDPVCNGRVARATIRSLAFLIVTPPAPLAIDGAAERGDVLAYVDRRVANARSIAGNATALPDTRETAGDRRRQFEALRDELAQGLHTGAAALASDLAGLGTDLTKHEGD